MRRGFPRDAPLHKYNKQKLTETFEIQNLYQFQDLNGCNLLPFSDLTPITNNQLKSLQIKIKAESHLTISPVNIRFLHGWYHY